MITLPFQFASANHGIWDVQALDESDLPDILTIEQRSNVLPWSEKNFRSSINSNHICLAIRDQQSVLVGYLILSVVVDQAEVLLLVVDKSHWGRGIAKGVLHEAARKLSRACVSLFLEVRASNERAIALYETVGFNRVGVREDYYPCYDEAGRRAGSEDAWIYALELFAET